MYQTYGDRLLEFARSVDIVDDQLFKELTALIERYALKTLGIHSVRIMLEGDNEGKPGLVKFSLNAAERLDSFKIRGTKNKYYGQTAYAFDKKTPIWVVAEQSEQPLADAEEYRDLWSNQTEIPKFVRSEEGAETVLTSIIIPLRYDDDTHVFGVMNFETKDHLECTDLAREELKRIAAAWSILHRLFKMSESRAGCTKRVMERLQENLSEDLPKLTKPRVFLAYGKDADPDVIDLISETLRCYADNLDIEDWQKHNAPGNINAQLLRSIRNCRFGICYLSEPSEGQEPPQYRDNSNVVFEAGMFHGRVGDIDAPVSWIPVREKDSPNSPFDFAAERMITVPRMEDEHAGEIDDALFVERLRNSLDLMLSHRG